VPPLSVATLTGPWLSRRLGVRPAARLLMVTTAASFLACAGPFPFAWFFVWRFVSGVTGGALMAFAAPTALRHVPPARRGLASGIIFTGVGLGIVASGTLTPMLLAWGLVETWVAFAAITLLVTLASWRLWPAETGVAATAASSNPWPREATVVIAAYGLIAAGLVPHMVFLADYVARGLGSGIAAGAALWVVFGLGATAGPFLAGAIGDRIGFAPALAGVLIVEAGAIAMLLLSHAPAALVISSLLVGAFVPSCGPLVIGSLHETISDPTLRQTAWSRATAVFAFGQATAAYLMSLVFAHWASYDALFALGAAALLAALALNFGATLLSHKRAAADR
jgi:predicted MFS family arabinose efflux permease